MVYGEFIHLSLLLHQKRSLVHIFFENDTGAVTINAAQYRVMLENLLRPAVENHPRAIVVATR